MIKLKSLLEGIEKEWRAWWMDPQGKLFDVYKDDPRYGHFNWARDWLKARNQKSESPAFVLIQDGWIRITYNYYLNKILHFDHSKSRKPSNQQMREMRNIAIEIGAEKMVDDNNNKEIDLMENKGVTPTGRFITYDELKEAGEKFNNELKSDVENLTTKEEILNYLTEKSVHPQVVNLLGEEYITFLSNIVDLDGPFVYDAEQWIYSSTGQHIVNRISDKLEERFNKMFWERPEALYHATPLANVNEIKTNGLKMQHKSRSLSNRQIRAAVFTSTEPEAIVHSYGPALFAIDTNLMKQDGFTPEVSKEPSYAEQDAINHLAKMIHVWSDEKELVSQSDGTDSNTIIVHSNIPPKYLKQLE